MRWMKAPEEIGKRSPEKKDDKQESGPANCFHQVFGNQPANYIKDKRQQQVIRKEFNSIIDGDQSEISILHMPGKKNGDQKNSEDQYVFLYKGHYIRVFFS